MAQTNQVNTVTSQNVVPVGATYDADGNFITLVGNGGQPISSGGAPATDSSFSVSSASGAEVISNVILPSTTDRQKAMLAAVLFLVVTSHLQITAILTTAVTHQR